MTKEKVLLMDLLANLKEDEGLTLKDYDKITYKSGYQVATTGYVADTMGDAFIQIFIYDGNCGVWYHEGKYYIDRSYRESTKTNALLVGRKCNQISILKWADMSLIYC